MSNFLQELKRRNVFKVAVAYVIVAWLLAQVTDVALTNFGAPEWAVKTILFLLVLGLPIAILFAWAFELTPDGIKRDADVDRSTPAAPGAGRKLDFAIIGLLAIALAYFVYESRFSEPAPADEFELVATTSAKSIAVLPFVIIGGDTENEYLSDGLAETLLHMLAQIEELRVAARTSAFKFKNTNEDVRIIGNQLGVETVLEGSIQKSGDRIRITAQLINVEDGFHLFSETYDRTLDDIFAVQDEIAGAVVDVLQVTLLGSSSQGQQNPEAYNRLMQLRSEVYAHTGPEQLDVIGKLKALTDEYPGYADAHATLSEAYRIYGYGGGLIPEEDLAIAIDAASKAIELAPGRVYGHIALARAYINRGFYDVAEPITQRAYELEPGNAEVLAVVGELASLQGEHERATELLQQALLRDPLNSNIRQQLAQALEFSGRPDDAINVINVGLELEPGNIRLQGVLSKLLKNAGRIDEALRLMLAIYEAEPGFMNNIQELFFAFYDAADYDRALEYLEIGERLSTSRLADERALYCREIGDEECWHGATLRMMATRDRFFVQTWQARMLLESGLVQEAIDVLLPVVAYFDRTRDTYGNAESRTNLAALYHVAGDEAARDAALEPVVSLASTIAERAPSGWGPHFLFALAAAARDDVAEVVRHLETAESLGFRQLWAIDHALAFDLVRDEPDFQAFRSRIQALNRDQISAVTN